MDGEGIEAEAETGRHGEEPVVRLAHPAVHNPLSLPRTEHLHNHKDRPGYCRLRTSNRLRWDQA